MSVDPLVRLCAAVAKLALLAPLERPISRPASAEAKHFLPIHREAPSFQDQGTEQEILVTGIKVTICSSIMQC